MITHFYRNNTTQPNRSYRMVLLNW